MTNPIDEQNFEVYLPVYDAVPEKWEDARGFLTEQLKRISNEVNLREIGWFLDEPVISGKQFIPSSTMSVNTSPNQYRTVFRKVINFGPLPSAGNKAVPHGLMINSNFSLVSLWAAATDPISLLSLQAGFAAVPTGNNIQLFLDSVNVNISNEGISRSNYTICYVTIEYMQEP